MESLNLNTLATSLPTSSFANADKQLMNDFKAAALSITTFYRSSRTTSKRAYNAGYASACQDLLQMIQQGVSVSDSGEMTIGRVMDWVEARLDAVKAREEEEEEEEERERERREPGGSGKPSGVVRSSSAPVVLPQHKDPVRFFLLCFTFCFPED
ncbi:hypothetical protein OF83DRAFT_1069354 [Amylostereum chailletii]|nr:hypothetical protein OF83DRAFT_1069354 [Amylostereum chailletii]